MPANARASRYKVGILLDLLKSGSKAPIRLVTRIRNKPPIFRGKVALSMMDAPKQDESADGAAAGACVLILHSMPSVRARSNAWLGQSV